MIKRQQKQWQINYRDDVGKKRSKRVIADDVISAIVEARAKRIPLDSITDVIFCQNLKLK